MLGGGGAHFDTIAAGATVDWETSVYIDFSDNSSIDHIEAFVAPSSVVDLADFQQQ